MLKILEKAFLIFALLYFAGGLILILDPDDLPQSDEPPANASMAMLRRIEKGMNNDTTGEKNRLKLAVQLGIYAITATLICFNLRDFLRLFWRHKWLWILLLLAMISTFWSDVPGFTARRSLVLLASTCFAIYVAQNYTLREVLRLFYVLAVVAAVASFLVVWRKPEMGIASGATAGNWQGIFGTKNTLGRFMALEVLACTVGVFAEKGLWRWFCVLGGFLCLPLLIMSKDATAYLVLPALFLALPLFQLARTHSLTRIFAVVSTLSATIIGIVLVIIIDPNKLLQLLGKDSTLSGRTEIWKMVWQKFLEQPWQGYGYSAFWMGKDGKESAAIWQALHWAVPHSHNGFLDLLLQVGIVGLALFLVGYVIYFRQALRCARASRTILGLVPLLYLAFMFLFNLSEGTIIREESIFWVLYATIWVLTTRWLDLAQEATQRSAIVVPARKPVRPVTVPAWRLGSTHPPIS